MSGSRPYLIGPLNGYTPTFGGFGADGQKALGQTQEAPVFPVSDRRMSLRSMLIPGPELVQTAKIVWRDTVDANSDLNVRLRYSNLRFAFTGKARLDNGGTADPGRLSEVLQPRGVPRSGARQLAAAENSPTPTGAVLSSAFAAILCSLATPPPAPATPPTAIAAPAHVTAELILPLPENTEKPISGEITKFSDVAPTTTEPPAAMEIDASLVASAAVLAAYPPGDIMPVALDLVPMPEPAAVAEPSAPAVEEDSEKSQASEAAEAESSPDPSSDGDDVDEEADDASHEQDASDGSSSSEFVPRKKRSATDGDAEATSGESDASDDSDDNEDEGDSEDDESDSASVDKCSEEYDDEDVEEEEDDDDDDDEDEEQDSDDVPLTKSKKRKSAAASPPKKRTPPTKSEDPAVVPAPPPAAAPTHAPAVAKAAAAAEPAPRAANGEDYPLITKLLGAKYLQDHYVNDSADKQTLTAIYNLICLKNGASVFANPLREALQSGFQFATANKKQKQALEIHAIEFASKQAELQNCRDVMQKLLKTHPGIGDKMRQVLRIICSEKYVLLESMPLIPKPGQRCELTNVEMVYQPGRNIIPRSCRIITIGPATVTAFTAADLTYGALSFFYHYFHMPQLAMATKLWPQTPEAAVGMAMKFYTDQLRSGKYVQEWAVNGEFKKPDFGIAGMSTDSNFSFHWKE